jgi:hypothetical protein
MTLAINYSQYQSCIRPRLRPPLQFPSFRGRQFEQLSIIGHMIARWIIVFVMTGTHYWLRMIGGLASTALTRSSFCTLRSYKYEVCSLPNSKTRSQRESTPRSGAHGVPSAASSPLTHHSRDDLFGSDYAGLGHAELSQETLVAHDDFFMLPPTDTERRVYQRKRTGCPSTTRGVHSALARARERWTATMVEPSARGTGTSFHFRSLTVLSRATRVKGPFEKRKRYLY